MDRIIYCLSFGITLSLFAARPASAQQTFDRISNRDLLFLIRDLDFEKAEYLDSADDDSWTRIQFEDDKRSMVIFNYTSGNLMLAAYYPNEEGETRETLQVVNQWNQSQRWCRAYISTEGNWIIEADLDLTEGVTEDHIEVFIEVWVDLLDQFETQINF